MIWEQQVSVIAMLTSPVEKGTVKCEVYWPTEAGTSATYGAFTVQCERVEQHSSSVLISTLLLRLATGPRDKALRVSHLHYTGWPDHGVPQSSQDFLAVVGCLEALRSVAGGGAMLVHCSAGVGRTGVLVVVTVALDLVSPSPKRYSVRRHIAIIAYVVYLVLVKMISCIVRWQSWFLLVPELFPCCASATHAGFFFLFSCVQLSRQLIPDIPAIVQQAREGRVNMVQTAEQYEFIFRVLLDRVQAGGWSGPDHADELEPSGPPAYGSPGGVEPELSRV